MRTAAAGVPALLLILVIGALLTSLWWPWTWLVLLQASDLLLLAAKATFLNEWFRLYRGTSVRWDSTGIGVWRDDVPEWRVSWSSVEGCRWGKPHENGLELVLLTTEGEKILPWRFHLEEDDPLFREILLRLPAGAEAVSNHYPLAKPSLLLLLSFVAGSVCFLVWGAILWTKHGPTGQVLAAWISAGLMSAGSLALGLRRSKGFERMLSKHQEHSEVRPTLLDDDRMLDWGPGRALYRYEDPDKMRSELKGACGIGVFGSVVLFAVLIGLCTIMLFKVPSGIAELQSLLLPLGVTLLAVALLALLTSHLLKEHLSGVMDVLERDRGGYYIHRGGRTFKAVPARKRWWDAFDHQRAKGQAFDSELGRTRYYPALLLRCSPSEADSSQPPPLVSSSDDGDVAGADTAAR